MSTKTNIFILCAALALLIFLPGKNDACAGGGTIATQTCDTGVWTAMSRRAQLEAEREVMQNQNLIFKADSVLTYTCFDNFAAHAALNTGRIFTHTGFFGPPPVNWGAPNGMDNAMQNVVINSMRPYIDTNFGHAKLGGRGQLIAPNPAMAPHVVEPIGSGRNYNCNTMSQVWMVAKCVNFIHNDAFVTTDGFYPFIDMAGIAADDVAGYQTINDVRNFPTDCAGTPINGSTWIGYYRGSRNELSFGVQGGLYAFQTPLNQAYADVRELIEPGLCGASIPTGIQVLLSPADGGATYPDGVCTNPGCTFTQGGTCTATPTNSPAPATGAAPQIPSAADVAGGLNDIANGIADIANDIGGAIGGNNNTP